MPSRRCSCRRTPTAVIACCVDPGERTLDWFFPSPDGRLVACGLAARGSEQSVLHLVDAETGTLLPDRIPHTSFAVVAWLPDSSGFYFNASLGPDTEQPQKHIFFHRVGATPPAQPEPAVFRDDEDFVFPQVSPDGRWVAAISSEAEPRPDSICDRSGDGVWRPFLLDVPAVFNGCFLDERYLAVTTEGAPRGRLVSIPLSSPTDRSSWTELVPEGRAVLRSVTPVAGRLVLEELVDTSSRLRIVARDGTEEGTVPLPHPGGAGLAVDPYRAARRAARRRGRRRVHVRPVLVPDGTCGVPVRPARAPRRGHRTGRAAIRGRGVPGRGARARRRPGHRLGRCAGPPRQPAAAPTLVHGYGGWNMAFGLPVGLGSFAPFVEAGGTMVFAHLRGGGEYGVDQWLGGFRESKQRTFDDLYAVVEQLVADGVAASGRVAVVGASNGGCWRRRRSRSARSCSPPLCRSYR